MTKIKAVVRIKNFLFNIIDKITRNNSANLQTVRSLNYEVLALFKFKKRKKRSKNSKEKGILQLVQKNLKV